MDAWLKSPKSYVPGTKMSFAGLPKVEERAAIAAYLNAQGSNLPLPAFTAAAPAGGAPAEGEAAAAGAVATRKRAAIPRLPNRASGRDQADRRGGFRAAFFVSAACRGCPANP